MPPMSTVPYADARARPLSSSIFFFPFLPRPSLGVGNNDDAHSIAYFRSAGPLRCGSVARIATPDGGQTLLRNKMTNLGGFQDSAAS